MPEYILTVLDTPGIQSYIFGSNRLRENIGASELVRRATEVWPLALLKDKGRSNVAEPNASDPAQRLDGHLRIEDGELDAEVVYIGGGNTVLLFRDKSTAQAFVSRLSRKIIETVPGLRLVAAHVTVNWEEDDLGARVDAAMTRLAQRKQAHPAGTPLLGLSVTAEGRSTGLVATTTNAEHDTSHEGTFPISDAVAGKLEAVEEANRRLRDFRPDDVQRANLDFPLNFDHFGRSAGEMSYLAVVHADGNEMGRFFRHIRQQAQTPREYIEKVREASILVEQAASAALKRLITDLAGAVEYDAERHTDTIRQEFALHENYLPFRPLVFGGDDVTFVCDGRLGLTLAARYLEAFEEETQNRKLNLYACAGIAVVKSHYPFARAYDLSQALTGQAKRYARDQANGDLSALNWHFATGGLLGNLQEIRKREYTVPAGTLTMRPLPLHATGWQSWPAFTSVVETLKEAPEWKGHHNKVIALREILRQGPEATRIFLKELGETLPPLGREQEDKTLQRTGWIGENGAATCGYFDAIEALEYYIPLSLKEGEAKEDKEVQDADV